MRADYHVYTAFSDDSTYPMEDVVRDAIARGIAELCFTEHVDYGIKKDWDEPGEMPVRKGGVGEPAEMLLANADYPRYYEAVCAMQEKYAGQICIRFGLEFGAQAHTIPRYEALFRRYPFDFIILSVHEIEDRELWNQDFQRGRSQQEVNERYYEELLYLVRHFHDYSVLGHMDLVTRYDLAGAYPFEKLRPVLTEILSTVIADGKGIELNTSSHRYGLSDLTPSRNILRLYHELGGRILTIGSDSHKPDHLGAYIDEGKAELRTLGFREFCTFERMQPIFHAL